MRVLAALFNRFPVRWQRRFMTAANDRFLVGVVGLGVDAGGAVILARHNFGAPQWRFLGGFLHARENVDDALRREVREETGLEIELGPILEVTTGFRWQRVEVVYAYRLPDLARARLSGEIAELRVFPAGALPEVRADQRGIIERHHATAAVWAATAPASGRASR